MMEKGTRIKFVKDIIEKATGEHPTFELAKKGGMGTIDVKLINGWYSVYSDNWKEASFLVKGDEIEMCETKTINK